MRVLRELDVRSLIALLIVAALLYRYVAGDIDLADTVKSAFMIAVGYFLGSSKGSADKTPPPAASSPAAEGSRQ